MTFGELLKVLRQKLGMTQRELSEKTGIAEPTIRKYESGRLNPKIETKEKFAAALGMPHLALLPGNSFQIDSSAEDLANKLVQMRNGEIDPSDFPVLAYWDVDSPEDDAWITSIPSARDRINTALDKLNEAGKEVAAERVEELTQIPKYQKTPPQAAAQDGEESKEGE